MNLSKFFRLLLKLKKILIIFSLLIIHNNVANSATAIVAAGGSTVHLREFLGDVQYLNDSNTWINVSFPITINSTSAGNVQLNFGSGSYLINDVSQYIINGISGSNQLNISYLSTGLPFNNPNGSMIGTFSNSADLTSHNAAIDNDGLITTINNTGTIESSADSSIVNTGTISNLINYGTISGAFYGISNLNLGSIGTLTNTGTIHGTMFGGIESNGGTITTINNMQGAGNDAGALFIGGILPLNYNIIIRSTTVYGQLSNDYTGYWTNGGTFNIYGNSGTTIPGVAASTVTNFRYKDVLQGIYNLDNMISGQTGTYIVGSRIYNYSLERSIENPGSSWDLLVSGGQITPDTQSSLQYQSYQLRSAFNTQTVAANFALNYDCNVFDIKDMCISAGGRYTTIDNPNVNHSAATVTLGYKVNPNIRIGAYLDQNINISNPTGIDISNNTPLMGLYAVWNKEQSGLGYQVRLANTYQDKDVTSTRTVFGTSEAGSGKSSLKSQSYLAELSYAFQYQDKTIVRPYAGLRYTHLKQKGYTEDATDTLTDPLTLASLRDKGTTALLGLKINRSLTDKATLTAQLGLEQDLYHKVDNYSASDAVGGELTAIAFNSNIKRTRPVASLGAFYDVTKTQRASATINYQQTPFQSTGSATAYFNYMIGF
jgi:hypothetical protein